MDYQEAKDLLITEKNIIDCNMRAYKFAHSKERLRKLSEAYKIAIKLINEKMGS